MKLSLSEALIVGGTRSARGDSPFARGTAVLRSKTEPDVLLKVASYLSGDAVSGDVLDPDEWRGLVEAGEALELERPVPAKAGAALWVFRQIPTGLLREAEADLVETGSFLAGAQRMDQAETLACIVDERTAGHLRDRWAARAFDLAWTRAEASAWEAALEYARVAFSLGRVMAPERVAFLALAYERLGRKTRAEGYLSMIRRSQGEEMRRQVSEKIEEYRRSLEAICRPAAILSNPPYMKAAIQAMRDSLQSLEKKAA